MGILNLSSDETHPEKQINDIERGSDETTKRKARTFLLDAYSTSGPYHATIMYEAMYNSLMFTPWVLGMVLRSNLKSPTTPWESRRGLSMSSLAGGLIAIVVGAAIEAPLAAGAACLHNVIGSWLMRMHHSHDDFAFHGGAAQGYYAIAGALSMLPAMAILVIAKPRLDDSRTGLLILGVYYLVLHFAFSAAVGAAAAAIGAARGMDVQTVANSTVANVAGMGFIAMVLFPFCLNVYLFFAFFEWLFSGL